MNSPKKPLANLNLIPLFWTTLFDEGDSTCLAKDKFGTKLFNVAAANPEHPVYETLQYFSINAMSGDGRADDNVVKYRSFLVEFDRIAVEEQVKAVAAIKMPYSTATFSGSKSIHYIISLEDPLPNRAVYDFVVEWIYNILEPFSVDTQTKNPSRFSRVPGGTNVKFDDEGNLIRSQQQKLLKVNGRVSNDALEAWLLANPHCQPTPRVYDRTSVLSQTADPSLLSTWTQYLLQEGVHSGKRNQEFHKMGFDFIQCGFSADEAVSYACEHAKNLADFPKREIESAIRSAYKTHSRRES